MQQAGLPGKPADPFLLNEHDRVGSAFLDCFSVLLYYFEKRDLRQK